MSLKRKWDQAGPTDEDSSLSPKAQRGEDAKDARESKSASEAAAAAAAIAAKIAAQFAGTPPMGGKDAYDGAFVQDIDINDIRNRYILTKGATQEQINAETGASVTTKGVWYPDRSKATEKDPPLYLHISASSNEQLDAAIAKVNELISMDIGSLVEDKKDMRRERRKWPEEKLNVGLESLRNFNVRAKVVGPSGMFVKFIQQDTGTRVQIKGQGSGFIDQETGRESDEPMHIHITGPDEGQVHRAKVMTEDLLEVVRHEHTKSKALLQQQQMELHHAQAAYAAYTASYTGYYPQGAPPPPPGEAPPPPPGAPPPPPGVDGASPPPAPPNASAAATPGPPAATDADAYARYWAAYGYDVNSPQFKEWQAQQQQQYAQYYAQMGYDSTGVTPSNASSPPPPPANGAAPPPPGDPAPAPPPPPS